MENKSRQVAANDGFMTGAANHYMGSKFRAIYVLVISSGLARILLFSYTRLHAVM